ncbi:MAG: DUF3102 domain-containing protein [Selenomonadaceae bacterium]|nr:DUF3102 domain-containing protein [Selenomonadaceae bacterium]
MKKLPLISRADYNTILLHTEKISNGQHDFISVLRRELCDKLRIADAESLISDLVRNKDVEFLNRVRLFLSQFSFVVVGDDGAHYQLVKRGNFCDLDLVEQTAETVDFDTPARELEERKEELVKSMENGKAENLVVEEVTLEVRAERIRRLQADVQRGIIEIGFELIAAKKQVGHGSWSDWLDKEFAWTRRTAERLMAVAERFGKCDNVVAFQPSTLVKMLALPEGEEQAFIEAQAQAGNPVEKQSARQVQAAVKKWKNDKKKKSSSPFDEINLFPEAEETVSQSVDEYKPNPNFDSSDSELNSTPTEESDESVDDTADELAQTQNDKFNFLQEETLTVNSYKKISDDDLTAMRDEMQQLLAEISERIQRATKPELADTIQLLKSVRALLN